MTAAEQFQARIDSDGLQTSMRWLNRQVPYRFTAIFRFDGDMLRNVCLVDKLNSEINRCDDQPITESYCIYINRTRKKFCIEESLSDHRVADHPKRPGYQCYYGIPLFDRNNRMVGTVCHFDTEPVRVTDSVISDLDELGSLIADAAFPAGVNLDPLPVA